MSHFLKVLIISLILTTPVFAQNTSDVDYLPDMEDNSRAVLNDNLRRTNRRLMLLEGGIPLTSGVTGILPLANGGTASALSDPGADRILFWDESESKVDWLTIGSLLTVTTTTISADVQKKTACSFLVRSTGAGTFDETGGYDTGGDFASNNFTAPVDGRYLLSYTQQFTAATNSQNSAASVTMGGKTAYGGMYQNQASSAYPFSVTVTVILDLSATNTVTATYALDAGQSNAGVVNNDIAKSFWSGILIEED